MSFPTTVPMSSLCSIKSGKSDTKDATEDGEFTFFDRSKVIKRSSRYLYDCEALIVAGEGAEFLPKHFIGKFDLHQRAYAIHNFNEKINVKYLYYYLHYLKDYLPSVAVGATVKSLRLRHFENLPVVLFSIATQQKIVEKLDSIFAEIDRATVATEANVKNAEALFQSYLTEVFERGGDGWGKVKLSDVVKEIVTGPFGSALHKSDYVDYGIPVINPQNLVNGKIIPLDKTMVSESTKSRLKKYSLKQKDIVIARRGEMGRCGLVDAETEGWLCGTGSMIIRLNDRANENYIFQLLQSNRVRRELESASIGATMSNLNQSILLDVQFSLPPIEFQLKTIDAINNLSEKTYSLSRYYIKKIKEHSQLKQSILKKAFSGELVKEE